MDSCEVSNRVSISSGPMELHATVKRPGRDANHSLSLEVMKIMCLFINLLLVFKYIYIYIMYISCMSLWFSGLWTVDSALGFTDLHSNEMTFLF